MSHELENMLYVGETPWHRLGVPLDKPPTIEEAIHLAGLDWTVDVQPLYLENGTLVPDANATVRSTDNKVLGVVGPRFTPLQNKDAFAFFDPMISEKQANIETAGSLKEGRRVWILAKINRDPLEVAKDDPVRAYVLLAHAHDGSLAVHVGLTLNQRALEYAMQLSK